MHQARYLLLGCCLFGCATPPAQSPAISRPILHLQTRDRVLSGFDEATGCGHLLMLWLRPDPCAIEILQHVRWPGCDPWRLAAAPQARTVYLQDRRTGWIHAVPWPERCRSLPTTSEFSPPLTPDDLYGLDLIEDYALFGIKESLIVYRDHVSGSRPFWDPRFEVRWSPTGGWSVEWYFISDDPDAWVIS